MDLSPDSAAQLETIIAHIVALTKQGASKNSICIVARNNSHLTSLITDLEGANIQTLRLGREGDSPAKPGVRVATMHRVKGIEFDHIIITHLEKTSWTRFLDEDGTFPTSERSLIYVAATRARKSLLLTSSGDVLKEVHK